MFDLLLKVIVLGIGSTVSPVIFGVIISLLAGKHYPKQRALACLGGAVLTALIISIAGWAIGGDVLNLGAGFTSGLRYFDILLGTMFLLFALSSLVARREKKPHEIIAEEKAQSPRLVKWFVVGFILNITNFDAVLLYFTEVKEIFQAGTAFAAQLLLDLLGGLFFVLPSLLPILVYITMQERAERVLKPIGVFLEKYGRYPVAVIFLVFGAYLLYRGLTNLSL
ncbi:GAP family protein [Candidatus Micrarchaeota archaeon]|nr:GAP family protein [Candidatus Micrarchaeota archaeon]